MYRSGGCRRGIPTGRVQESIYHLGYTSLGTSLLSLVLSAVPGPLCCPWFSFSGSGPPSPALVFLSGFGLSLALVFLSGFGLSWPVLFFLAGPVFPGRFISLFFTVLQKVLKRLFEVSRGVVTF